MSDDVTIDLPEDDAPDMAAAELALGVIEGDERSAALRRVLAEPAFAREVERWRAYLAQLFDLWPPVDAPQPLLARIERTIDGPAAAPILTTAATNRFWPIATAVSGIAAALLLVVLVSRPDAPTPPSAPPATQVAATPGPVLVAAINPSAKGDPVSAVYDPKSGALRLTAAALASANQSAELWVIGGDGVPHSLGLLRTAGGSTFTVNAENRGRLAAGAVLAVSLEPVGGSPTGVPTGPVVATGALSQV